MGLTLSGVQKVAAPALAVPKARLGRAGGSLGQGKVSLPWQGWHWMSFKVPPTQTVLGFCDEGEKAESCHRQLSQLLIAASLQNEEGNESRDGCPGGVGQTGGN